MQAKNLSAERESLLKKLEEFLADHKECVDQCKNEYANCMNGCGNQICARKCRQALESCINSCPGFTLDDEKRKQLNQLLDKIEETMVEE